MIKYLLSLTPSVLSSGMFDSAIWRFSRVMTMENFAFMLGSSKQGKAFLASVGSNWVVARYLEQERKHQTFLATSANFYMISGVPPCLTWQTARSPVSYAAIWWQWNTKFWFWSWFTVFNWRNSYNQKTSSALKILIIWQKRLQTQYS